MYYIKRKCCKNLQNFQLYGSVVAQFSWLYCTRYAATMPNLGKFKMHNLFIKNCNYQLCEARLSFMPSIWYIRKSSRRFSSVSYKSYLIWHLSDIIDLLFVALLDIITFWIIWKGKYCLCDVVVISSRQLFIFSY